MMECDYDLLTQETHLYKVTSKCYPLNWLSEENQDVYQEEIMEESGSTMHYFEKWRSHIRSNKMALLIPDFLGTFMDFNREYFSDLDHANQACLLLAAPLQLRAVECAGFVELVDPVPENYGKMMYESAECRVIREENADEL